MKEEGWITLCVCVWVLVSLVQEDATGERWNKCAVILWL